MATLFDELEMDNPKMDNPEMKLQISTKNKQVLSKTQTDFNKIIARIQKLEKELVDREQKLDNLLQYYNENVLPANTESQDLRLELCFALDEIFKKNKFSKKVKEQVSDLIQFLFDDVFSERIPTKEQEELYDAWSESSYQEEVKNQMAMDKAMFSQFMDFSFGVDVDLENVDMENPESFQKFKAEFEEKMKSKSQEREQKESKPKKKTKKQLEKEALLEAEQELKTKSIRGIYISLTKILHPDIESDPMLKQEKEEIMKQVINAYEEKDLSTLLKLEMEWVHKTSEHLSELSENKLKAYISVMRERAKQLEAEKYHLAHHPRFAPVHEYRNAQEKHAIKYMNKDLKNIHDSNISLRENIDAFQNATHKNELTALINSFHDDLIEKDFMYDFMF